MGWFADLARDVFSGFVAAGRAFVEAAAPVVSSIVQSAQRLVNAVREGIHKAYRDPPATERDRIERDLEDVNEQIMALRNRFHAHGELSENDKRQHERLHARRADLTQELAALEQALHAEEVVEKEEDYKPVIITDAQAHILQYHVGQSTSNKRCRKCGRDMTLQWNHTLAVAATKDFFWGCTGWYFQEKCTHKEPLSDLDFQLFVNTHRSEFQRTPTELASFALEKNPKRVADALRDIQAKLKRKREGVERYRCPIHKERLLLREKKVFDGLIDQFFLGCPRWLPDKSGCNFVVKLKSAAQMSAVFDVAGEGGLIATVDRAEPTAKPANAGKPWANEDDAALIRAFDAGVTIEQLAKIFERGEMGITTRLQKHGKLPNPIVEFRGA